MRSKWDIREILQKNAVTVMFVLLCLIGLVCSGQTVSYVMYELFGRLSRNSFIVLALIIPIIAGMGIGNFLHHYVIQTVEVDMMMFGRNVFFRSYFYSGLITLAFALFVNGMMFYRLRKIDMIESLKSVE